MISTTLQSKISKTKKRLSDNSFYFPLVSLGFIGFLAIAIYVFRGITVYHKYGMVTAELPLMAVPLQDPGYHTYQEVAGKTLAKTTPMVVLTDEAFYFGDLEAFGPNFSSVRNKFMIRHKDRVPQLGELLEVLRRWDYQRSTEKDIVTQGLVVLLPAGNIPAPIVIQTIDGLKQSPIFDQVILASGLL